MPPNARVANVSAASCRTCRSPYALPELANSTAPPSRAAEGDFDSGQIDRGCLQARSATRQCETAAGPHASSHWQRGRSRRSEEPTERCAGQRSLAADGYPDCLGGRWQLALSSSPSDPACPTRTPTTDVFFANVLYPALNLFAAGVDRRSCLPRDGRSLGLDRSSQWAWHVRRWVTSFTRRGCRTAQSPSIADPAYLAFYPLVYVGLLLLMRMRA